LIKISDFSKKTEKNEKMKKNEMGGKPNPKSGRRVPAISAYKFNEAHKNLINLQI
jgi:hypothetical protein